MCVHVCICVCMCVSSMCHDMCYKLVDNENFAAKSREFSLILLNHNHGITMKMDFPTKTNDFSNVIIIYYIVCASKSHL